MLSESNARVNRAFRAGVIVLAALVLVRTCVSFQFQSLTILRPILGRVFPIDSTEFGLLLGLYMAPGAVTAIIMPVLTNKVGARAVLYSALGLMAIGQCGLLIAESIEFAFAARVLSGVGGCIIYILIVDLAAQLSDSGQASTRMGVIAASWPFGNALALVLLGTMENLEAYLVVELLPVIMVTIGIILTKFVFGMQRSNLVVRSEQCGSHISLTDWQKGVSRIFVVGTIFALYNVSFILLTSFSPQILASQGYSRSAATTVASLPMWFFLVSVPLGGVLAAGGGATRGRLLVAIGCFGGGLCILFSLMFPHIYVWYALAGILGGLPTAPILAKAVKYRKSSSVIFPSLFLIFFIALMIFPPIVGALIDWTGNRQVLFVFCVAMLVAAFFLFILHDKSIHSERSVSCR